MEKANKLNEIYKGKVLRYNVDEVLLDNGEKAIREVVHHPGGVGILAIKDRMVYLVKQFRYVFNKEILEIPAGKLNKNEDPYEAAKREFNEELGFATNKLTFLGEFYPSVGYTDEVIHLYFSDELTKDKQHLDEDEFLDVVIVSIDEFEQMIKENKIKDGKTIAAYHLYKSLLNH